jgi:hypothetical protein
MNPERPRRRVSAGVVAALGVCGMCCSLVTSCGDWHIGRIDRAVEGSGGSGGGSGGGSTADGCNDHSVCMQLGEGGGGPLLVWIGPKGKAPTPPMRANSVAWSAAYANPIATGCGACTCGGLDHTCTLPTSMTAYDVLGCPAGQPGQSFDAASPWAGACDDNHPILAPNNVQSLLVGAIDLVETCKPSPSAPGPLDWELEAVAFRPTADVTSCMGDEHGRRCVPNVAEPGDAPEGFHLCMMNDGDSGYCNDSGAGFTEPHRVYRWFEDSRMCDPCTCTPPAVKGTCVSFLSVYQNADTSCNGPEVTPGIGISSDMSTCFQINPAKQPLGSKSATAPQYAPAPGEPGCQPGGGALHGSATPSKTDSKTFCCLP